jgi:ATPase, P-type (transporting), HAD superfamily, subfamily IC/ATPase, P-type (transporting), HAD superfamily, subfamily IC
MANFGFLGVVVINLAAGIIQELRAKKTIDKLSLLSAPKVTVYRDGAKKEIAVRDVVLDDEVSLAAGNQICADSIIEDGVVEVNESLLTGEPDPIQKKKGDEILSGSFIVSGTAAAKVIRVGKDNYATKISSGAKYIKPSTSIIFKSISKFIKIMAFLVIPLGMGLFSVKYFVQDNNLNKTVITVTGTIIGMIPSGLMLLTTGVFCISVIRLSTYKALAQDLHCAETLARVDVLCLDKTGTITEGAMMVNNIVPIGVTEGEMRKMLKNLVDSTKDENPTALAIKNYLNGMEDGENPLFTVPFSSKRKWSGASFKSGTVVMGAAEFVFKKLPKKIEEAAAEYSECARVLVLGYSPAKMTAPVLPATIKFAGFVLIADKIRNEAPATLRYFREQGVDVKILSGDNPVTVSSVARRAGMKSAGNFVDATTLSDKEIPDAVEMYSIFGRVTPDQKLKIVKALKERGHTVAMTGDGVNDVLALKEADCSIAMAAGSDAAKNVSEIVLLDSNFASMPKIVAEGRRSINNLERSASLFLVKTGYNFFFAILFLIIRADLPFEPKHLSLLAMIMIGIPSYFLALEPNRELVKGKFLGKVIGNALPCSLTITIAVVAVILLSKLLLTSVSSDQISTMALIITGSISFLYLLKICYPFNTRRVFLVIALAGIFAGAFFADFEFFNLTEFFGLTTDISPDMAKIILPVAVISIPIFIAMYAIANKINGTSGLGKKVSGII